MQGPTDILLVLLILTCFFLLGSSRLGLCIRMISLQGLAASLMLVALSWAELTVRIAALSVVMAVLKGFVFPWLLLRTLRASRTSREVQPYVGYVGSIVFGLLAVLGALWLDSRLSVALRSPSSLIVPVGLAVIFIGLFLIVARRTAINQVIGYLALENGIAIFGLAIVPDIPVIVELGVLMDLFVAVFVMGIAIYRISREFDHIDSHQLTQLRG